MNWFSKIQIIKHIIKLNQVPNQKKGTMKTAASLGPNISTKLDWKHQTEDSLELGNFQRYICDSYTIRIFLTQTNNKYAVSLITNHTYLGTAGWSIFWTFTLDQGKKAQKLFKKVSEIARKTTEEFIREEKPTVLLHATLRQKFKHLKRRDVVRTNIPTINYSYDLNYETDWRKSIYGPRYPKYEEVSFEKYLNSSIYSDRDNAPSGKFAL